MRTCPRCGKQYEDDQAFCGVDGTSLTNSGSLRTPGASDSRMLRAGALIGAYRVLSVLGKGGMGIVYAAEHARLGKRVAVKVLRSELVEDESQVARFFHEARAANSIGHENIVEVHDFIEEGPFRAFVMELLEGVPLSRELAAEKPMALARIARIGRQIADGLAAVHDKRIIHRDLKPDNVFLTTRARQDDFVKLLDFGVAKLLEGEGEGLTQTGTILGTPAYMAPEQLKGEAIDARVDIYSLGVILYQMTSGRRPFKAKSIPELMIKQVSEPPPPLPNAGNGRTPAALERLIFQCLEKDRSKRPADMREVEGRLAAIEEMAGVNASGPYPAAPGQASVRPPLAAGDVRAPRAVSGVTRAEATAVDIPTPGTLPLSSATAENELPDGGGSDVSIASIASQLEIPRPQRSRGKVAGAIGGLLVVAAGVAAAIALRAPATPSTGSLELRVESTPTGAEILLDESVLGVTPANLVLAHAMAGRSLELRLPGHAPGRLVIPEQAGLVTIALTGVAAIEDAGSGPSAEATEDADAAGALGDPPPKLEPDPAEPAAVDPRKADKRRPNARPNIRSKPKPSAEKKRPTEAPVDPFR